MNNETRLKFIAALALIVALGIFAGFRFGKAYQSEQPAKVVAESGSVVNFNEAPTASDSQSVPDLGALTSPDLTYDYLSVNGDVTKHIRQTFADATTTFISIMDPFVAPTGTSGGTVLYTDSSGVNWTGISTTVDYARLKISGAATTSYYINCGASATAVGIDANLNSQTNIVSSTAGTRVPTSTTGIIENNLSQAAGGMSDGGTISKIEIGPAKPWLVCNATGITDATAFTNALNTFDGVGMFRFNITR